MQTHIVDAASSPHTSQELVLSTHQLSKQFRRRLAVNNLDLAIHRGDVFGLLGPNGSGKTTTIRMILGLIKPTHGHVQLFGNTATRPNPRDLQRVGAIIEQPTFYPYLSGRENLRGFAAFSGLAYNRQTHERIDEVLKIVGLADRGRDTYRKYSLGMKQRLGIAAALLSQPELIILDEPTNGLDPAGVVEIRKLVNQLASQGITIVISSHLLYEVQQVCSRVAIIQQGKLIAQGEVASLLANRMGVMISFADPARLAQAAQLLQEAGKPWIRSIQYTRPDPGMWVPPGGQMLLVEAPVEHITEINALLGSQGVYAAEVRRREGNLEQYFLEITGSAQA